MINIVLSIILVVGMTIAVTANVIANRNDIILGKVLVYRNGTTDHWAATLKNTPDDKELRKQIALTQIYETGTVIFIMGFVGLIIINI